jgi:RNA-directed DNA polymerase
VTKSSTHGFIRGKSIVTNGKEHVGKKHVLNLDLKDFFPSINFGRVRGLLMAKPYQCTPHVATIIAQICCHDNQLPQGSPTSPIISNMICAKLDTQFQRLAKKYRCFYTRYADDITISSSANIMPSQFARFSDIPGEIILGNEIVEIIEQNGFQINDQKVRLRTKHRRQEVTGLIVNEKLNVKREYVRTLRTMLYQLEKNILSGVEIRIKPEVIRGKIEFLGAVRGYEDSIYLKFLNRLNNIAPETLNKNQKYRLDSFCVSQAALIEPEIWTEGKTDPKHLKAALRKLQSEGKFNNLNIDFKEEIPSDRLGYTNLLKRLRYTLDSTSSHPIIHIFDRDIKPNELAEIHDDNHGFKYWKNAVYSFALPIPSHRRDTKDICIEHYYTNDEIMTKGDDGRRLFLGREFDNKSNRHINDLNLSTTQPSGNPDAIIDNGVYDGKDSVAMSKDKFASHILEEYNQFSDFNFFEFAEIFKIIQRILLHHHDHMSAK